MDFRDVIDIRVQGGKGGDGGLSFLRMKYMPKGGPDGGNGGRGGSVYLRAIDDVTSLRRLVGRTHFRAEVGGQGQGRNMDGAYGKDLYIDVPVGTMAHDLTTGELVADLVNVGDTAIVARGGEGGRGNASFATSTHRTPRFAQYGTPGEKRHVRLELRAIADVGLVGYPNAGKSSLLAALSNSRPRVASYPFTTLSPNLGVVEMAGGLERFTMADIPGIIEDAHLGKGLGLDFLRHISRTRLLVYVLDAAEEPGKTLASLQHELEAYDPELLTLPALIVLNKVDLLSDDEPALAEIQYRLAGSGLPLVAASALTGGGIELVRRTLFELLPPAPDPIAEVPERRVTVRPTEVKRDLSGLGWVITGTEIEAVVARFDPTNRDAVAYLQRHFKNFGVSRLLKAAGAKSGDEVQIGEATFDYFDETAAPEVEDEERGERRAGDRYLRELEESEISETAGDDQEPAPEQRSPREPS